MPTTFTFENLERELAKDAQLPKLAVEAIRTAVKLEGPRLVQEQIEAVSPQPVDRGTYRRSFRFQNIPGGATAYNYASYAPVIEAGRRPGAKGPPLQAIIDWVKRKGLGIQFGPKQKGKRGPARRLTDAAARGIAYTIARAIKRRGLPAHWVLDRAAYHIDVKVREAIQRVLDGRPA